MAEPSAWGFWTSLPGVLTAVATVITALTGAWLALSHGRQDAPGPVTAPHNATPDVTSVAVAPPSVRTDATPALPPGMNLLAVDNGGALVFSGSASWDKMIDGIDDRGAQIGEHGGDFGVYAFRGRQPEASAYNPKAIELSYATESQDGPFLPIGVFEVRDGRVAPDGRQVFHFAPITARFLKVKLREARSGGVYIMAYEFGALGTLAGQ